MFKTRFKVKISIIKAYEVQLICIYKTNFYPKNVKNLIQSILYKFLTTEKMIEI